MNRILRYSPLALAIVVPSLYLSAQDVPLIAGTLVQCTLNEQNFSSHTAKVGEPIVCYARPLHQFGCAAFSRETELAGRFVGYKNPGRLIGKGWIQLDFDRLIRADGEAAIAAKVISVQGFEVDSEARIHGRGHPKRDAIGWAVPILWPIKLVTLPMRGPRPTLKGERVITLRLLEDVRIPCRGFGTDSVGSGWHRFGSSSRNYQDSSSPSRGFSAAGSSWRGEELGEGVPTDQEQRASSSRSPLVLESGHHVLVIGPARRPSEH